MTPDRSSSASSRARQLTDLCLLALAVHRGERFVTLDGAIAANAVRRATSKHPVVAVAATDGDG